MCYSGTCPNENWHGECKRKKGQLCPLNYEDKNNLAAAEAEMEDLKSDHLYDEWLDNRGD